MTQIAPNPSNLMTIEDYLAYDDGTDKRYELVDGQLLEMTTESPENCKLAQLRFVFG